MSTAPLASLAADTKRSFSGKSSTSPRRLTPASYTPSSTPTSGSTNTFASYSCDPNGAEEHLDALVREGGGGGVEDDEELKVENLRAAKARREAAKRKVRTPPRRRGLHPSRKRD